MTRDIMKNKVKDKLDLTQSACDKIDRLVAPLGQLFKMPIFGYRKFFPDGTSFNISNSFSWTKFCQEKFFAQTIPTYENEINCFLKGTHSYFLRIGQPEKSNLFLSTLYDFDIWNTLSLYKKSGPCIEGFYFTSTKDNFGIIEEYINNIIFFERFSVYFKSKISEIITEKDIKNFSSPTVSPALFQQVGISFCGENQSIKSFISETPIYKFFLHHKDKDINISPQEFKCLALLSRGKTAKEIGLSLNLSSRTVESYLENVKSKLDVRSRSHLVDIFRLNFNTDKNLLAYLENNIKEQ